jgi:hypothetical protein
MDITDNLNPNSDRVVKRSGKKYVFVTNVTKGDAYFKGYKQLKRSGYPVIFVRKAYDIMGKRMEDHVAIFVETESLKKVDDELDKIVKKPETGWREAKPCPF